jgi:hypothetical protein
MKVGGAGAEFMRKSGGKCVTEFAHSLPPENRAGDF